MKHTLEWYVSGEPFFTAPGTLSAAVSAAVSAVAGITPQMTTGGGTSDGRFIAPHGAEVVELGVVNATIHKVNECVRVDDIDALHRMYVAVLRNLLTSGLRVLPTNPSTSAATSSHAGIASPAKLQLTWLHSPPPGELHLAPPLQSAAKNAA